MSLLPTTLPSQVKALWARLMPVSVEEEEGEVPVFDSDLDPTLRAGVLVVVLMVGGFFLWAALTDLASGVHIMGEVAVETNRKSVQHLEGGIVKELLVREGDFVRQGDPLVVLDQTQTGANREVAFGRLVRDVVTEARLLAQRLGEKDFQLPEELAGYAELPQVKAIMADQRQLLQERLRQYAEEIAVQEERLEQNRHQLEGLDANLASIRGQLALLEKESSATKVMLKQGFATMTQVRGMERELTRLRGEAQASEADRQRLTSLQQEARQQLSLIHTNFNKEISAQLEESRSRQRENRETLISMGDALRRSVIRSPADGQVVGLMAHTVGGVIQAGMLLMYIVPAEEKLVITGQLRPLDKSYVHAGVRAEVKFMGLPKRTTPLLFGKVTSISSDTLGDPAGKMSFYLVRIEVPPEEMQKMSGSDIVPGMPVEVLLEAGKRTALEYLTSPWTDLFGRAMREQ